MHPARLAQDHSPALFEDGLGRRVLVTDRASGETLEALHLRDDLCALPSFEFALRERIARLANFQYANYARVRRVDRIPGGGLAVVSEHVPGLRLSEVLDEAERRRTPPDTGAALCLLRHLLPAVSLLHENARDVAHGALGPERVVVTLHARPVIVEHVLGAALEQLQFTREQYWRDLRVAAPPAVGLMRLDQRSDIAAVGLIALALVFGRTVRPDEYPEALPLLIGQATGVSSSNERRPLTTALQTWLARLLQIDSRRSFASARDAYLSLEEHVLAGESGYVPSPIALEAFLTRCAPRPVHVRPPDEGMFLAGAADSQPPPAIELGPTSRESARRAEGDLRFRAPLAPRRSRPGQLLMLSETTTDEAEAETETEIEAKASAPARSAPGRGLRIAAIALALAGLAEAAYVAARPARPAPVVPVDPAATLSVESRPSGVPVFVDGVARGSTPVTMLIKPGAHILELRGEGTPRVVPLTAAAGAAISKYLELSGPPAATTGTLHVSTDPPGASVAIDGEVHGTAPLTIEDIQVGVHTVTVTRDQAVVSQLVEIGPGASSSLVVPLAISAAPVSGWIAVSSPLALQIFEGGRLLGSSESDRIMVAAGRHELELVNETVGLRTSRTVQVPAGKIAPLAVELPLGVLHLNALPWAEVWIDGRRTGETPLGNLELPVGPHEILFRHPQLGERRHAVTVTLRGPARVSVDLRPGDR